MRKRNYKGRCEKRSISKCKEICRTYDSIQYAYADVLQQNEDIKEIKCNVLMDGLTIGEYTSDFVCIKADNALSELEDTSCHSRKGCRNVQAKIIKRLLLLSIHYETECWLQLFVKANVISTEKSKPIAHSCGEIRRMPIASINILKNN